MTEVYNICGNKVQYVHIKSHYFLFNAALCGVFPFLHIYGQQLGVSAMTVGIIFSVLPLLSTIAKPLVGSIADYTKRLKIILYVLLILISISCVMLTLIPKKDRSSSGRIICASQGVTFSYSNQSNLECIEKIPKNKEYFCFMTCKECSGISEFNDTLVQNYSDALTCKNEQSLNSDMKLRYNSSYPHGTFTVTSLNLLSKGLISVCGNDSRFDCSVTCDPVVHDCYELKEDTEPGYLQLVPYIIFLVIIHVSSGISITLGDAACFNILSDRIYLYGRQRLWGTVGWGTVSPCIGILNYLVTGQHFIQSYYAGFCLVPIFLLVDIIILKNIEIENLCVSKSIWKDILKLLRKADVVLFIISVFVFGALTGVLWTFLYWYLNTLDAPVFLLGLIPAVECLLGELPIFLVASKIISSIGHFNTLTVCFVSFGVRFFFISRLDNPWWILPIGFFQGPTFGLFYATYATYANVAALPGTETTMQGLIGGVFEGLGIATGSLLGGIAMQKIGAVELFFYASVIAFSYSVVNMIFTFILRLLRKRKRTNVMTEKRADERRPRKVQTSCEETNFM